MFPILTSLTSFSPQEQLERKRVVDEAETWRKTPYYWLADKKGVGVDCLMLLVRCYVDTGIIPFIDPRPYNIQWHLHNSEELYINGVSKFADEVPIAGVGDIIIFKYGRTYSHGAIIISPTRIIHSFLPNRVCTAEDLDSSGPITRRPYKFYSVWARKR